LSLSK